MAINFENSKDLEDMRQMTREARELVLQKAERDYERRKAKKELAKLKGEDKWMLPELDVQLAGVKSKKNKKEKKEKKHKKDKKHKKNKKKDDSDSDEWVEKTSETTPQASVSVPLQRDEWMNVPSLLPIFSKDKLPPKRTSLNKDEEAARKIMMEKPGQTSRELNPYWKNGGTGLPPEKRDKSMSPSPERKKLKSSERDGSSTSTRRNRSRSRERKSKPYLERSREVQSVEERFRRPCEENEISPQTNQRFSSSGSSQPGWKRRENIPNSQVTLPSSSSSSSSSESEEEVNNTYSSKEDGKVWTEQELNALNAKIIKAEIMGQSELVKSLKRTLDSAKETMARQKTESTSGGREHIAVLTRTDTKGGQHPLPAPRYGEQSLQGSKGKGKKNKVETHQSGQRVRYFADDDKYSLNQMYTREKMDTAEDQNAMFSRLAGKRVDKTNDDFDLDDMFESRANREVDEVAAEARERQSAIAEHEKREKVLDTCSLCLDSKAIQKHLIVAIGQKCYLSLPVNQSLVEGHCLIVPRTHVTCATQLDEDVWAEMQLFRRALTKMFEAREADAIFFETSMHLKRFPHMTLECVPLSISAGETAPIYFKKALLECESEWAMNKKVIDLKGKDVRKAVPKGLPYFCVDFGLQSGFAHIIEDEQRFPPAFAQEILGGILDLEPHLWRRPRRENFDQQKRKVLDFAADWKQYDFTASLK